MAPGAFITGDKKLDRMLAALPGKVQRQGARTALRAAAAPVLSAAQHLVPVESGQLKKSLRIGAGKARRGSVAVRVYASATKFKRQAKAGGRKKRGRKLAAELY